MKSTKRPPPSFWVPAAPLFVLLSIATPSRHSHAVVPARADVASMEFTRAQTPGLESVISRPGTRVKVLLTHSNDDWRAIDFGGCRLTTFVDGTGIGLGLDDTVSNGEAVVGIQPDSQVSLDGEKAVLTIWGGGLPAKGAEEIRVAGSASIFCGPAELSSADRTDVRLAGGETFNVQPFRVVTTRDAGILQVELRYLKTAAYVKDVILATPAGSLPPAGKVTLGSSGEEWVWRGEFLLPPRGDRGTITVRYLPIEKVEAVPFDVTAGIGFNVPSRNPVVRWLKRVF